MTITYRLIGKGTTDENGIAHMDYSTSDGGSTWTDISSNPGYTGVGAGEIDLLASTDNPITSSSCQSKPYPVYDTLFYDKALDGSGNHNDGWYNVQNRLKVTRGSDGTTLESLGEQWAQWYVNSTSTVFNLPFAVEFDVISYSDTPAIRFNNGTVTAPQVVIKGHWKFLFKSNEILVFKDNHSVTSFLDNLIGSTDLRVFWELSHPTDVVKFKDFMIYPI